MCFERKGNRHQVHLHRTYTIYIKKKYMQIGDSPLEGTLIVLLVFTTGQGNLHIFHY